MQRIINSMYADAERYAVRVAIFKQARAMADAYQGSSASRSTASHSKDPTSVRSAADR